MFTIEQAMKRYMTHFRFLHRNGKRVYLMKKSCFMKLLFSEISFSEKFLNKHCSTHFCEYWFFLKNFDSGHFVFSPIFKWHSRFCTFRTYKIDGKGQFRSWQMNQSYTFRSCKHFLASIYLSRSSRLGSGSSLIQNGCHFHGSCYSFWLMEAVWTYKWTSRYTWESLKKSDKSLNVFIGRVNTGQNYYYFQNSK